MKTVNAIDATKTCVKNVVQLVLMSVKNADKVRSWLMENAVNAPKTANNVQILHAVNVSMGIPWMKLVDNVKHVTLDVLIVLEINAKHV